MGQPLSFAEKELLRGSSSRGVGGGGEGSENLEQHRILSWCTDGLISKAIQV